MTAAVVSGATKCMVAQKEFVMRSFFRNLLNATKSTRPARSARPQFEALEKRDLMSASPLLAHLNHHAPIHAHHNTADPIQAKYQSLGGPHGFLGRAITPERPTPDVNGRYQLYQHGAIFWSAQTGAHDIYGPVEQEYLATGHETDAYGVNVRRIIGLPTSDETTLWGRSDARTATFQRGLIDWSATSGAHAVYGAILAEYDATACERDAYGYNVQQILGLPTSEEMNVPGVAGARMNTFQGGVIDWSAATGAHVVYGGIGAKYNSLGGPANYGLPTSDEASVAGLNGVRVTQFQGGRDIYWSQATGAHAVYGAIGVEYAAIAYETDAYGYNVRQIFGAPTSDEMDVAGVPGARMNTFQGGTIYWSASTGAHVVYGAIGSFYASDGGPAGLLGLPTTDEANLPNTNGGRISYFEHGEIYWTPQGGVHVGYTH